MNVISESITALENTDWSAVDKTVEILRKAPRIFCVGNGGGAAHATHFASDLRKIAGKQAFSFDNVAEMTARINDDGWERAWWDWRQAFGYDSNDVDFLFSVGGALDRETSANLMALDCDLGLVGAAGRYAHRIVIPSTSTPVIEGCQSVIAHHIVEQLCA
jgi:D-sedoheptulose 7-phosphate isomerase